MTSPAVPTSVARVVEAYNRLRVECYAWVAPDGAVLLRFPDAEAADQLHARIVDEFPDWLLDELAAERARRDQERAARGDGAA